MTSTVPTPAALIPPTVNGLPAQTVGVRVAAQLLNKSERTIRRWVTAGALPAVRTPGGGISLRVADLNRLGTPAASEPAATESTSEPTPAAWTPLTDEQWLEACLAPRGSYSLIRTAREPHDLLVFWGAVFDRLSEPLGKTAWGSRRAIVRPQIGPAIVVEHIPADELLHEPDHVWQPTAAVDSDAADRLRHYGFEVRDGQAVSPDGDVVNLVVTEGEHGIIGWNMVQAGA
ncbi:helix-turn-helix domain-containing protein [Mycobacteroides abscessus]|uniref:helix-turn-helix domain-containing protein n=1 Tax=Mycobacteroides abscessus TaxID=36809 RepID=UPI0019CFA778|nr:helix-turn-helix domain-containing protein [Mycobacteroides abscessus]MBN7296578.1 hypothetical protein [Mycobacteroides abscessus subsp. abscessus]